jgi:hypothetical protein
VPFATSPTGQMTQGRSFHTATALADGRVLVAGGYFDSAPIKLAELYDPQTGAFIATGSMTMARGFDTATRPPPATGAAGRGDTRRISSGESRSAPDVAPAAPSA